MITALHISDLDVSRGERRLFTGFGLQLAAGEAVALTGANGSGKTSLLRAIAGLLRPDAGTIAFAGAEADEARREAVHLLGHNDGLKSWRKAADELAFAAAWAGAAAGGREAAVAALQLAPLLDLEVRVLSAGQRRRLALARLIAAPRALWLLDEPMAPLDAGWRARLAEVMSEHLAGGGMILAAVHDPLPIPARTVELAP